MRNNPLPNFYYNLSPLGAAAADFLPSGEHYVPIYLDIKCSRTVEIIYITCDRRVAFNKKEQVDKSFYFIPDTSWVTLLAMTTNTVSEPAGVAITTILSILVIVNVTGNSLVCAAIIKHHDMRYVNI